jgi:hypothetical protein
LRKITTITHFIQDISFLIDKGVSFSVEEINSHIENKNLVDWLEGEFPFRSENGLDFSLFKDSHRDWIHEKYDDIFGGYEGQERRKWGIENNGLCLLISWGTEIIRDLHGRDGRANTPESEWLD